MGDQLFVVRDEVGALATRTSGSVNSASGVTFDTAAPAVTAGLHGAQVGEVCAAVGAAADAAAKGLSAKLLALSDKSIASVEKLVTVDAITVRDLNNVNPGSQERWA
ncbi:hypothetical protein [Antrihabitans stalactiti]|uniref:Excreted virulence factor EspC, type VII ESX diderm n=1 Tax=Antrihabitans stalactiti TaxID=2584121 RepID=A0A848KLE9_9NOCA|nr:hypothetical protein [Antrihabitans stalactiti]NMN97814.1 hypothetical protein [Antrihabitans stalactiti]